MFIAKNLHPPSILLLLKVPEIQQMHVKLGSYAPSSNTLKMISAPATVVHNPLLIKNRKLLRLLVYNAETSAGLADRDSKI